VSCKKKESVLGEDDRKDEAGACKISQSNALNTFNSDQQVDSKF
jgi:hypothetical protein